MYLYVMIFFLRQLSGSVFHKKYYKNEKCYQLYESCCTFPRLHIVTVNVSHQGINSSCHELLIHHVILYNMIFPSVVYHRCYKYLNGLIPKEQFRDA